MIFLIKYLFKFSPKFTLTENKRVQILKQSKYFQSISMSQKILVYLFENKAFDDGRAIKISEYFPNIDIDLYLEDLVAKVQIKKIHGAERYYLTKSGRIIVISLYSDLTKAIFDFKYSQEEFELKIDNTQLFVQLSTQIYEVSNEIKKLNTSNRELSSKIDNLYNIYERVKIRDPKIEDLNQIYQTQNKFMQNLTYIQNLNINQTQPSSDSSNEKYQIDASELEPISAALPRKRKSRRDYKI